MKSAKLWMASLAVTGMLGLGLGCATAPTSQGGREELTADVHGTLDKMYDEYPGLRDVLNDADGYVVFPEVGKGGLVVGGAYGRGEVFQHGQFIGYSDITQATIGAQVGGQSYSEIIAFQAPWVTDQFRQGKVALDANASAVILTSGAAVSAKYQHGVAIFADPHGGAMLEASVGGQDFAFEPE